MFTEGIRCVHVPIHASRNRIIAEIKTPKMSCLWVVKLDQMLIDRRQFHRNWTSLSIRAAARMLLTFITESWGHHLKMADLKKHSVWLTHTETVCPVLIPLSFHLPYLLLNNGATSPFVTVKQDTMGNIIKTRFCVFKLIIMFAGLTDGGFIQSWGEV